MASASARGAPPRGRVPLPTYYHVVASLNLDAFVCPLVGCAFNEAKPALKPLEAEGLGPPVIASRVGRYAEELTDGETAVLVGESTEAWLTALTRSVDDADLRAHLAAGGRAWAAMRTIDATGPLWATLWDAPDAADDRAEGLAQHPHPR